MKKNFYRLSIAIIFLLLNCAPILAQQVTFPTSKPLVKKKCFEIKENYRPDAKMLQANPEFHTKGKYVITRAQNSIIGWMDLPPNSSLYEAIKFDNENKIILPGKAIVMFISTDLKEVDSIPPYLFKYRKFKESIPAIHRKYARNKQFDLISSEGYQKNSCKFFSYWHLNEYYTSSFTNILNEKSISQFSILPALSSDFSKMYINANDLIFEFGIDHIQNSKFNRSTLGESYYTELSKLNSKNNIINLVEIDAVFYRLNIRDASGKIIKSYGQAVFLDIVPYRTKKAKVNLDLESYMFNATYQSAFESLLNQFSADPDIEKEIKKNVTALRIKETTDKEILKRFELKSQVIHYNKAMKNCIDELEAINDKIKDLGGSGVDFSGVKPTVYSSTNPEMGAAMESTAYGIAALVSLGVNASREKKIRKLEQDAQALKKDIEKFKQMETMAVSEFNKLIKNMPKLPTVTQTPNDKIAPAFSLAKGNTNLDNFWEESVPSKKSVDLQAEDAMAGNNFFWEEVSNNQSSNQSAHQPQHTISTLEVSSNLINKAQHLTDNINRNAEDGRQSLNSSTQRSLDWANQKITENQTVIEAATAGEQIANNGNSTLPSSAGCPQGEAICQQETNRLKGMGMNATNKDMANSQIRCIKATLQYCNEALSPEEISAYNKQIKALEEQITHLNGGTLNLR